MINKFEQLDAWKTAKSLAVEVYLITNNYPKKEIFALTNQTTRAAISIAANIAEGSSRSSAKDYCHFLEIALGSAFELKTLVEIAFTCNYINSQQRDRVNKLITKSVMLIYGLKRSLNGKRQTTND